MYSLYQNSLVATEMANKWWEYNCKVKIYGDCPSLDARFNGNFNFTWYPKLYLLNSFSLYNWIIVKRHLVLKSEKWYLFFNWFIVVEYFCSLLLVVPSFSLCEVSIKLSLSLVSVVEIYTIMVLYEFIVYWF